MAKKKTAYTRNRNRVLSYIRKLNKQNILVDLYFPTEREVRQQGVKGSELTKLTNQLKRITFDEIKSYGVKINPKPENILQHGFDKLTIDWYKGTVRNFPIEIADKFIALIDTMVREQGVHDVAVALESMPHSFHEYLKRANYDSETALQDYAMSIIEYLPDASEQYKKDLSDAFEYNELGFIIEG